MTSGAEELRWLSSSLAKAASRCPVESKVERARLTILAAATATDASEEKLAAGTAPDAATAALYQSAEGPKLYEKWFMQKIPPKGLNLNVPIGPEQKKQFSKPQDSPDPDAYAM